MRPPKVPGVARSLARVTGRTRQVEHRYVEAGEASGAGDIPWCRLVMETSNQTVPTPPAAPQINFTDSVNNYPSTFDVQADGFGVLSVALLEDGLFHVIVYIKTQTVPTNGYYLEISGDSTIMETAEDFVFHVDPLAYPYNTFGVTFRGGPDRGLNVYAFVRQIAGNAAFDIRWADTFMEIYKLGSVTNPA